MFKKLALVLVVAAATCSDASAHWFRHHRIRTYAVPAYGYVVPAPVYYAPAPAYYPAPVVYTAPAYYPAPVYSVPVLRPPFGYYPAAATVRVYGW